MDTNLSIAVCDDEADVYREIKEIINSYAETSRIPMDVITYSSGNTFLQALNTGNYYDLAFVDIKLGTVSGLRIGEDIRNKLNHNLTHIYYVTGYPQDPREVLHAQPLDLIPKPIQKEDIYDALDRSRALLQQPNSREKVFSFRTRGTLYKIPIKYILYFQTYDGKILIKTMFGEYEFCSTTLTSISEELKAYGFVFSDRSFLVNFNYVELLKAKELKILGLDETLPVAQQRYIGLKEIWRKHVYSQYANNEMMEDYK